MNEEFNPFEFPIDKPEYQRRVNSEVIHVESDEPQTHAEAEAELSAEQIEEAAEAARKEERQKAREANPFWQFISGNWLILEGVAGTYRYLLIVATALFLSVVSIFYSFHQSERYTQRAKSVQLLRERSLEFQRVRFNSTSHSAITKELQKRGIPLYNMQESKTIIEK